MSVIGERVWTLTASNRLGTVGAPIVDHGPRIEPYTSVEVVPASQLQGAVETMREAAKLDTVNCRKLIRTWLDTNGGQ